MTKIAVFFASFIAELIYTERAPRWLHEACMIIKQAFEFNAIRYGFADQLGDPVPDMRSFPYCPSRWRDPACRFVQGNEGDPPHEITLPTCL
jgi:hypothetical protein